MNFLNRESKRKNYKLVGAHLPPREYNYFNLYCLAKGITKSSIILKLLNDWMQNKSIEYPQTILNKEIANRINLRWKAETQVDSFREFKECIEEELKDRGISNTNIIIIINQLKE